MDDRLQKAIEHANYAATIFQQKKILELRFENALMYSTNGGTFVASRELITFISALVAAGNVKDQIVLAEKNVPVLVSDVKVFLTGVENAYNSALADYYMDLESLRKARTVSAAVES